MLASTSGVTGPAATGTHSASSTALEDAQRSAVSTREGQRNLQNAQILQASMEVSIAAGNDGLSLLYRTAIDKINEVLAPELGEDAIAQAAQYDQSSEAVAGRIVALSTAIFERFAARYADEDPAEMIQDFVATIRSGFEQGYGEARDILSGLGVWEEGSPVRSAIERTYALVHQGLDEYLEKKLAELKGQSEATA